MKYSIETVTKALVIALLLALIVATILVFSTTEITINGDLEINQTTTYNSTVIYVTNNLIWNCSSCTLTLINAVLNVSGTFNTTTTVTSGLLNLTHSILVVNGGEIKNLDITLYKSTIITTAPLTIINSSIIINRSTVIGDIKLVNTSITIENSMIDNAHIHCENCSMIHKYCVEDVKVLLNSTIAKLKGKEHPLVGWKEIEINVTTPGVKLELEVETNWCSDNKTVVVLPNGTIVNIPLCKFKLILNATSNILKLKIYHGVYDEVKKVLLHVNNASILSYAIQPRPEIIANVTVDAPSGTFSIVVLQNVLKPTKVLVNGVDVTSKNVTDLKQCVDYCWIYFPNNKTLILYGKHTSPLRWVAMSITTVQVEETQISTFLVLTLIILTILAIATLVRKSKHTLAKRVSGKYWVVK